MSTCIRGTSEPNGYGNGAHRWAWVKAFGLIPKGLFVLHRCDNRWCINPDHLFLGTQSDNIKDCYAKGRRDHIKPSVGNKKLLEHEVIFIRYKSDRTQQELADYFGVSVQCISHIQRYKTWKHL